MIHNKLDKFFGQAGSILGWLIILLGLVSSKIIIAILLLVFGSLMAFSYSAIKLDTRQQKYKLYYAIFGFISIGKWKNLSDVNAIAGVSPLINRTSYHKVRNPANPKSENCFVVLFQRDSNRKIPFKRCKGLLEAKIEAHKAAQILHLSVIS